MVGGLHSGFADDAAGSSDDDGGSGGLAGGAQLLRQEPACLFAGVSVAVGCGGGERQSGDRVFGANEECVQLRASDRVDT